MRTKQHSGQRTVPSTLVLITLLLLVPFSCSQKILAQQRDGDTSPGSNSSSAPSRTVNFNIIQLLSGEYLEMLGTNGTQRGKLQWRTSAPAVELASVSDPLIFSTNSIERLRIQTNGFVGMGTSNPQDALHIFDSSGLGTIRIQSGSSKAAFISIWDFGQMLILSNNRHPSGNNYNAALTGVQFSLMGSEIVFAATSSGPTGNATDLMRIKANGRVGIGTINPAYQLDVQGGAVNASAGLCIAGDCKSAWSQVSTGIPSVFGRTGAVVAAANDYTWAQINKATSSLGDIATRDAGDLSSGTLPDARFPATLPAISGVNLTSLNATNLATGTVGTARLGSGTANSTTFLRGDNTWTAISVSASDLSSGTLPDARFPATLPAISGANLTSLNASNLATGTIGTARLGSGTANSTTFLRGDNTWAAVGGSQWTNGSGNINYTDGNVGIGTTAPGEKLQVAGNGKFTGSLTVDGNIAAKYQDVAEWVPSSEQVPAGTVVVLDPTKSNQVVASTKSYDTRVAGVISAQPGIALGEKGDDKVLVATTGRVRVKVDASRAPIQIGDLLVTSDIAGAAMKSEAVNLSGVQFHRPGTLIGKALEPLAKGTGEILVLLSLQ